jgi:hypothetical protein
MPGQVWQGSSDVGTEVRRERREFSKDADVTVFWDHLDPGRWDDHGCVL